MPSAQAQCAYVWFKGRMATFASEDVPVGAVAEQCGERHLRNLLVVLPQADWQNRPARAHCP